MRGAFATCVLALLAAGCGTSDDRDQALATAIRFFAAIEDRPQDACEELSQATREQLESRYGDQPCAEVIARVPFEAGHVERTEVWITNAKIDFASGESAFLTRESDGWKLSALACKPAEGKPADRPLECEVEA